MSITSRINEMSTHIEQAYDELQGLGADLTNVNKNIENISMVLDDIYDSMPQVSGEGTSLTLDNTRLGKIKSTLKGNTSQTGTPTPSSPIPVNVVSGDNEVNVVGKNLLCLEGVTAYGYSAGVPTAPVTNLIIDSFDSNNITYHSTTADYCYALTNVIQLSPSTTYTISFSRTTTATNNQFFIYDYDNGTYAINFRDNNTNVFTETFTTNSVGKIALAFGPSNTIGNTTISNIMIEKGSSASTYEPYQGNTYNIDLPVENLWNENTQVFTNQARFDNSTKDSNNKWTFISSSSGYAYAQSSISLPAGTYIFSSVCTGGDTLLQKDGTTITNPFTITETSTITCRVFKSGASQGDIVTLEEVMLCKGSKANTYTPYGTTPIELCKIGNYQDYFYKDSGKWYLHKEIGKVVLNGTETGWSVNNSVFYKSFDEKIKGKIGMFSNFYSYKSVAWTLLGNYEMSDDASTTTIFIKDTDYTTATDFKAMLANNLPVLYYVLATPTNEEITYQPLIDQLNLLEKAQSKENQTNISQVNNDLPFIISASALKEWQESTSLNSTLSMVNPLSLGNTLNTQENDIQPIEVDNIKPLEEEENE